MHSFSMVRTLRSTSPTCVLAGGGNVEDPGGDVVANAFKFLVGVHVAYIEALVSVDLDDVAVVGVSTFVERNQSRMGKE